MVKRKDNKGRILRDNEYQKSDGRYEYRYPDGKGGRLKSVYSWRLVETDKTPQGKLMFTIFAGLAEFERTCLLERQREGIAEAKKQGKYKGRQPIKIDEQQFKEVYKRWKNKEITARQAMSELNIKPDTFYRRVKAYES